MVVGFEVIVRAYGKEAVMRHVSFDPEAKFPPGAHNEYLTKVVDPEANLGRMVVKLLNDWEKKANMTFPWPATPTAKHARP